MPDASHSRFVPPDMTRDCLDPWVYVEFKADGGILPCCVRGPIGNMGDRSLANIVNGVEIRALRLALLSGRPDEICQARGLRSVITPAVLQSKVGMLIDSIKPPEQFDGESYLDANPDVRAAGEGATRHFLKWGRLEGRPLAARTGPEVRKGPGTAVQTELSVSDWPGTTVGFPKETNTLPGVPPDPEKLAAE